MKDFKRQKRRHRLLSLLWKNNEAVVQIKKELCFREIQEVENAQNAVNVIQSQIKDLHAPEYVASNRTQDWIRSAINVRNCLEHEKELKALASCKSSEEYSDELMRQKVITACLTKVERIVASQEFLHREY